MSAWRAEGAMAWLMLLIAATRERAGVRALLMTLRTQRKCVSIAVRGATTCINAGNNLPSCEHLDVMHHSAIVILSLPARVTVWMDTCSHLRVQLRGGAETQSTRGRRRCAVLGRCWQHRDRTQQLSDSVTR